jgi:hypothetical protein
MTRPLSSWTGLRGAMAPKGAAVTRMAWTSRRS